MVQCGKSGGKIYATICEYVGNCPKEQWVNIKKKKQKWEILEFWDCQGTWNKFRRAIFTQPLYEDNQKLLPFVPKHLQGIHLLFLKSFLWSIRPVVLCLFMRYFSWLSGKINDIPEVILNLLNGTSLVNYNTPGNLIQHIR